MRKRNFILVIVIAGLVRTGFMLWSWSGHYYTIPNATLVVSYLRDGYSIAAGYGYTTANINTPAERYLNHLYERVNSGNIRLTPKMAGPLPTDGARPQMLHPPGMALLVAGINRFLGIRADEPLQVIGILFDSIAAGLVYWIISNFLSEKLGFVVGLAYALFPPLISASVSKTPEGLLSLFIVASLVSIMQASRSQNTWVWYMTSGLIIGIGSYLRPDYIFMPLFMVLGLWAYTRHLIHSIKAMILAQVVVLLVLLPWAYRNHTLCGRWIFTSTSVGGTLINGLGEFNNAWGIGGLDEDRAREAAAQGLATPWDSEADLYFRDMFWQRIRQRPGAYILTVVKRLPLVLATPYGFGYSNPHKVHSFTQIMQQSGEDRYQIIKTHPLYVIMAYWDYLVIGSFTLCCVVCVVVFFIKERYRRGLVLLLVCPHLYSIMSHLLTHLEPRFLLPSVFCWLIGFGYVLVRGWRNLNLIDINQFSKVSFNSKMYI